MIELETARQNLKQIVNYLRIQNVTLAEIVQSATETFNQGNQGRIDAHK